jgi:hypothetical protein
VHREEEQMEKGILFPTKIFKCRHIYISMPLKRKTQQHQRKSSNYKTHSNIYSHQTVSEEKIKRKTNNPLSAFSNTNKMLRTHYLH